MKFVKPTSAWLIVLVACFFAACNPGDVVEPAPAPDSLMLPTRVDNYERLSDTAYGVNTRVGVDSLIYLNGRLDKVIYDLSWVDPLTYSFKYTDDGKLASINALGYKVYNQDYFIHYVNNRIDSITIVDSSSIGVGLNVPYIHGSKMTYNAQGKLTGIKANIDKGYGYEDTYTWTYKRSASGRLDTLYGKYTGGGVDLYIRPSATISSINIDIAKIADVYIFFRATRTHTHLFSPLAVNLFIHYLLNKDDNLLNNGIFDDYSGVSSPNLQYKNEITFNADSTVKTFQYTEATAEYRVNDSEGYIFYYSKVAGK